MDLVWRMESSNKCRDLSPQPNIPPEIITEILFRLPVRSLLKFKCVCKSWLISISSSQFIKNHLYISRKSNKYSNYGVILVTDIIPKTLYTCPLSSIFSNTVVDNSRDFDFPMSVPDYVLQFFGSCNGLLCLCIDRGTLVLYNPSIRKLKTLPVSGGNSSYVSYGFCYDEISDDFKVVKLNTMHNQTTMTSTEVKIYSLRNDYWRKIENSYDGHIWSCGKKSVGGILHWSIYSSDGGSLIFAVNTMKNICDTLEPPKDVTKYGIEKWSLWVLNGCLAIFCNLYIMPLDVWAMKEYGVKESWSEVVSIAYPANSSGYLWPVFLLENDEFCLYYEEYMVLYNCRSNSFTTHRLHNKGGRCWVVAPPYIENLVEPSFLEE